LHELVVGEMELSKQVAYSLGFSASSKKMTMKSLKLL
jgi:hypothetical protein